MESAADRALLERFLRRRDEAAFRALYRAHTGYLLALALRLCGGRREAAEDVVQEAWLRAVAALPSFRWASRLRTWLGGFVVNCWREQRRREDRVAETADAASDEPVEPSRPEESLDLARAVDALPAGLRAVVVLHDLAGHTHDEIGRVLGIPAGTSKRRLFEARRTLRRRLRDGARQGEERA